MPLEITLHVKDARWRSRLRPCAKFVQKTCDAVLNKKCELSVVLADDAFVQELNRTYRGKNKPTNVLSFPADGGDLGDIMLAFETIAREAKEQKKSFKDHTAHLLVHGVLHLLGHDHERADEAEKMERLEVKILKKLNIANPYLWNSN